ncbi:hypothetical protein, partial [Vibrio parahaemolyticus]
YRQIGNAVPCGVGKAIGDLLVRHTAGDEITPPLTFKYSRYKDTDDVTWRKKHKDLFELNNYELRKVS